MTLIWINDVSISFGGPMLLEGAKLQIEAGERIGLVGRNGSGKTTLMKALADDIIPDQGEIRRNGNVKIAMLPQDVPEDLLGTVYDVVAAGSRDYSELLRVYHDLTLRLAHSSDDGLIGKLEQIQHEMEAAGGWQYRQTVKRTITLTNLDENADFRFLSAGMKRRVFLAKALASEPDLLLLDEPTNHLDMNTILWLEDFLMKYKKTIMFVTHDRVFLQTLATRIVEIDRGSLISFACDYGTYLERREAMLEAEEKQRQNFDKKLATEERWIRQGVKARRTRNEGRVRALLTLRQERARRREQTGSARLMIQEAKRSGRLVIEAEKITFAYDDKKIIDVFSSTILRGDKVGIIGPNGSGKTTLLRVLLGELQPLQGTLRMGTGIEIAYFDQLRAQLDENKTLKENVAGSSDTVLVNGAPRHVVGYLRDFLFPPEQIMAPVRSLSGGERNRLLLARLFSMPSNVLVLDEPTNDLDVETLELLEDRLLAYTGTVLLVSHDRAFLNNVVTSTIVFEGEGQLQEYVGGYDDWLRQRQVMPKPIGIAVKGQKEKKERPPQEKRKLSYKEAQALEYLPQKIEALENEQKLLWEIINDPAFYAGNDAAKVKATNDRLEILEKELEDAYQRWDELEDLAAKLKLSAVSCGESSIPKE
jgi:ATP-binding cassette subfamily F protein uup